MPSTALTDTAPLILSVAARGEGALPCHLPDHATIGLDAHSAARRNLWAVQLDDAVRRSERPVLLVAHGIGCLAVAWWARLSPAFYLASVSGALLIAPACAAGIATDEEKLFDSPGTLLPFPSIVVGDAFDDGMRALAHGWGSHWADGRSLGMLGRREGQAAWLRGERLLKELFEAAFDDAAGKTGARQRARSPRHQGIVRQRPV